MNLIDSNILIYSFLEEGKYLRDIILDNQSFISEISRVEVLGYHKLAEQEREYFTYVFSVVPTLTQTRQIFDIAIDIRQSNNLKLGDSLIAATAISRRFTLYTRNISDFNKVTGLTYVNPIIGN